MNGQSVRKCAGDANMEIVACAIDLAKNKCTNIVIADYTDVVILFLYHWENDMSDVYFRSEKARKTWLIRDIVSELGEIKPHHLFLHACTGCDSTSAVFGHGKTSLVDKMRSSEEMQGIARTMSEFWASQDDVGKAGERLFVIMYGGRNLKSLNKLR